MKSIRLFFVFFLFTGTVYGQTTQIQLDTSASLSGVNSLVHFIKPFFSHQGSKLNSDSADFNKGMNTFDGYGHVVIRQPDGTVINSDLLNYNGNTRIAILTNNVRMVDKDGVVLTTNSLTYNMDTKIGTYVNGGRIDNKGDVLTSKNGYYFDSSHDAYFRYNVVVTTKDAVTKSDTMRYNTVTRMTYFYGPTDINGKKDTLHTDLGDYDNNTRQAHGLKNNMYQQGTKRLKGNTLFYDDIKGYGEANGDVVFTDFGPQKIQLYGQKGRYTRADSSALITEDAYTIFITKDSTDKQDSVYMRADTIFTRQIQRNKFRPVNLSQLFLEADNTVTDVSDEDRIKAIKKQKVELSRTALVKPVVQKKKPKKKKKGKNEPEEVVPVVKVDSTQNMASLDELTSGKVLKRPKTKLQLADSVRRDSIMRDSIVLSKDTTRTRNVYAYNHVKIFKSDLQSTADSAFYSYQDSVIRLYKNPVVWSQNAQMSSDTIYIQLKNNKLDKLLFQRNGFITNAGKDSLNFNQIKGRTLTGFFKDNQLRRMYVNGSAESIYFITDSTGYTGMNHSEGSVMRISFENKEVVQTAELRPQKSVYTPYELVKEKKLKGFTWKPELRPKSKEEIIPSLGKKKPEEVPVKKVTPPAKPVVKPTPTPKKAVKPATS